MMARQVSQFVTLAFTSPTKVGHLGQQILISLQVKHVFPHIKASGE